MFRFLFMSLQGHSRPCSRLYFLSPGWLKIDPTFGPLRGNPRFERLLRTK